MKEIITTSKAPRFSGPLSEAVKCGNTVYIAGITGNAPEDWALVGGGVDLEAEAVQMMENLKAIVEAAGGTMDDIVSVQVFFKDISGIGAFNTVYKRYFKEGQYPARMALETYIYDVRPAMLRGGDSDSLFLNYVGEPMTRQGLWKILKEYGEEAGFKIKLTPQVIRNSFAVHMLQNGADIKSIQELMGHEDIAATQAYLAVTKNRIKDVYDRAHPRA